jgi:hypothetical protein
MADGSTIMFKPGEFKVFSPTKYGATFTEHLQAGFNPLGIYAGDRLRLGGNALFTPLQNPGLSLSFGHPGSSFNINDGATPGSFMAIQDWNSNSYRMPIMYQHDWFQKAQQFSPITLDARPNPDAVGGIATRPQNIDRWIFDGVPHPIAFAQLVIRELQSRITKALPGVRIGAHAIGCTPRPIISAEPCIYLKTKALPVPNASIIPTS